eukprot:g2286.t1
MNSLHTGESVVRIRLADIEESISPALKVLRDHNDLKFVLAEYLDPRSRINARMALQEKKAWIPKQVLQYVKEKREKDKSLKWNFDNLHAVVKRDKFELVKWACTFNKYMKNNLCRMAANLGKFHMLKWARKQESPLPWDENVLGGAFNCGHYDTLKWLIEKGCPWYDQPKTDFLQYVRMLEDEEEWSNVDVNQVVFISEDMFTSEAFTTLMMACHLGHPELVQHLLTHNGIMDDNIGSTCLIKACQNGHLEVVKVLLEHNDTKVNQPDVFGKTALHYASEKGHTKVVKAILSHPKTNVNQANKNGRTALHMATFTCHLDVVKAILSDPKFTNVNQADTEKKTALQWATKYGYIKIVKAILSRMKMAEDDS